MTVLCDMMVLATGPETRKQTHKGHLKCLGFLSFFLKIKSRQSSLTGGFCGREQLIPVVHDGEQGFEADFGGAGDEPADHFAPAPIDRRQRHPHDLQAEFEGHVEQSRMPRPVLRRGEAEGVLRQLEQMRRAVDVTLRRLQHRPQPVNVPLGGAQHGRRQGALLGLDVAQREPARVAAQHQRAHVAVDGIVNVLVVLQDGQSHGAESDPVGQVRVVRQQGQEKEFGVRVHGDALRVDAGAEAGSGTRFQEHHRLFPQNSHQDRVQFHLLQLLKEPLFLLARLLLRVEAGRHDSLLAETNQGSLRGQRQVRLVAIPRSRHSNVLVTRRRGRGALLAVHTKANRVIVILIASAALVLVVRHERGFGQRVKEAADGIEWVANPALGSRRHQSRVPCHSRACAVDQVSTLLLYPSLLALQLSLLQRPDDGDGQP